MIYHIMNGQETVFDKIVKLGLRFKEYRKALGVSQRELHRKTGVALSTISLFENGKGHGLSLSHFYLLLDALDLEMDSNVIIPEVFRGDLAKQWEKQNKRSES
ncbi:MAG: helix-turn-helix transcriptional regulator [Bacteroidales bacterium]|nr:helix-turn-helix transcriptional regulator [Bacteroidales bacterium]